MLPLPTALTVHSAVSDEDDDDDELFPVCNVVPLAPLSFSIARFYPLFELRVCRQIPEQPGWVEGSSKPCNPRESPSLPEEPAVKLDPPDGPSSSQVSATGSLFSDRVFESGSLGSVCARRAPTADSRARVALGSVFKGTDRRTHARDVTCGPGIP